MRFGFGILVDGPICNSNLNSNNTLQKGTLTEPVMCAVCWQTLGIAPNRQDFHNKMWPGVLCT